MQTMTVKEALKIQTEQIEHYKKYNPEIGKIIASKTNVSGVDQNKELPIKEINKMVPRGAEIELILGLNFGD